MAGLPSLLGVGPSPSLGCLALPNRLLSTIITSAEPGTHQHTIKVWPGLALTHPALSTGPETRRPARPGPAPPPQHLFVPGMPRSTVDLAAGAAGVRKQGGWQLCCCPPPPAVEVMCLFGLGWCSEKL
ncbi:unnamed protein product [Pleuronectes platessa]|uniref:Uncharacterized protein n=1 Tax=Pleuronectes platessa TaxID=8262 RepID=A0A9N7VQ00_PLEPL|nr:unnamed protein product [Pleuronectes platessa]